MTVYEFIMYLRSFPGDYIVMDDSTWEPFSEHTITIVEPENTEYDDDFVEEEEDNDSI